MKFGSVCSGIEAASVAWHPLGWKAAWLSEIEPFPSAVLAHHYPDVPNLGDMTTLPDRIRSGEVEAPDLFCGGTPCQAFSVAGQRKSLDDARGNLSLTFCEIANAIDERRLHAGLVPGIIFWENVPGVLNTKDNAFGCFLAELAGEELPIQPPRDKWTNAGVVLGPQRTVAWRVLDAQYFGVAQRRRRVFVVASARNDFDPVTVLFEFEGVRRDTAPRRETWEEAASGSGTGAAFSCAGIGAYTNDTAAATLLKTGQDLGNGCEALITKTFDFQSSGEYGTAPVAATLAARDYKSAKDLAVMPIAFPANLSGTQHASTEDLAPSMGAKNPTAVMQPVGTDIFNGAITGDVAVPLTHRSDGTGTGPTVMVAQAIGTDCYNGSITGDVAATMGTPGSSINASGPTVMVDMAVRRLTPVECERLQGFPDNYTNIPWRKASEAPDGPRYKALGNSWAVPVVRWIGARINAAVLTPANDNAVQATQVAA